MGWRVCAVPVRDPAVPVGRNDADSAGAIPGLAEADGVPLIASAPDPSNRSMLWTRAYQVEDLPPVNMGRPTEQTMADCGAGEADDFVWVGTGCWSVVGVPNNLWPNIIGIGFGGADVKAWAWIGVPDQTVAVEFTDQNGATTWQRRADSDRPLVFPDTIECNPDEECPACRLDAIDAAGVVIASVASVDLQIWTYVND